MKKELSILLVMSVLSFGIGACTQERERSVLNNPPGTYETDVSSTDASGTTTEKESSVVVDEDAQGKKTAVVKSKTTTDPKGLFNKTTTSQTKKVITEE